jgi:large subunit ribosomal protein L23
MKADLRHIIKTHIVTERTTRLRETNNEYVFEVATSANKNQIKEAIEQAFRVNVTEVRTMIVAGKPRRYGRYEGKTSKWKKAVVRLKQNETIAMFDNI